MEEILKIDLLSALDRSNGKIVAYVLPSVAEFEDPDSDKNNPSYRLSFILTYFYRGDFYIINDGLDILQNESKFIAGMRVVITSPSEGDDTYTVRCVRSIAPKEWKKLLV